MSFTFGFNEQDLNNESENVEVRALGTTFDQDSTQSPQKTQSHKPKFVNIVDITSQLVDLNVSLTQCSTDNDNVVYKRELFDIKHQVMTEDNEAINKLLLTNESDLHKDYYEGGFKVWEGSYDLIDQLAADLDVSKPQEIIEIGSGTSLPSSYIINRKFHMNTDSPLVLILSDFNYEVLRLVTIPNIIINWYLATHPFVDQIRLTEPLLAEFVNDLARLNIKIELIEGSWSPEFIQLLQPYNFSLVLTAETIYSLESLPILCQILILAITTSNCRCQALVAAKNFYFGVGGSVNDFVNYMQRHSQLDLQVSEVNSRLKRSVITVRKS